MRQILPLSSALIFLFYTAGLYAQDTLFQEDFNKCALPPSWQVSVAGSSSPVWYVGLAQNGVLQDESIDSTCFLFIDDYSTTTSPAYSVSFASPAFNVTPYQTVWCTMDVHFRAGDTDYLDILATDGVKETLLARFNSFWNNEGAVSDHFSLKHDLSFVSQSPNTRIIIRYTSPNGSKGRYAGIDNIVITGSGTGANVIREGFNNCALPAGWSTEILKGQDGWQFGRVTAGTSASFGGASMDGTCFVYFNDFEFEDTQSSTTRLYSPWFDGTNFYRYELNFDAILRYNGAEVLAVYVQRGPGNEIPLYQSEGHVGGPYFPDYQHFTLDLTPYRSDQMRLIFEYADNGRWGYWAGIDNVKVSGFDQAFDFCKLAMPLQTGAACKPANNTTALFDGPAAACSGRTTASLWYSWQADFSGVAQVKTNARFNDVVSIFSGSCTGLVPEWCDNHDEHGFTGETTYFTAQNGKQYYIRVSGLDEGFGTPRGDLCVQINQAAGLPSRPNNDNCANAVQLSVDAACTNGSNVNALSSPTLPSLNLMARADVWYRFTASSLPAGMVYEARSNATFSDIITVYAGGCNNLQEIAGNHKGGALELPKLIDGQTYYLQIAGNFATVEGSLCAQIATKQTATPQNDDCLSAIPLIVDGPCTAGANNGAGFSGWQPACAVAVDHDIWFKFVAPPFGSVHINTGARFEHTLALWEGDCNTLRQIFCTDNPLRCTGYVTAGNLNPGQTYYLQIAGRIRSTATDAGEVCVNILDGGKPTGFKPLSMEIQETCIGMDTARINLKVSGGAPPYTFPAVTPGQILLSGTAYLAAVADASGCETYLSGVVAPCASNVCTQEISLAPQSPACYGESDGAIFTAISGGTGPFEFYWSNGVRTADNIGLPAGAYTLTVVDANGCESIVSQGIVQPDSVRIAQDNVAYPTQGESNGAIQVTVTGGKAPYDFTWLVNGNPYSTGAEDLSGLRKGFYTLLVTDSAGCAGVFSVNLPETVGTKFRIAPSIALVTPNPARERTRLAVAFPEPVNLQMTFSDATGRVLRRWTADQVTEQMLPVDLSGLPGGVYFLHVQAGEENFVRKVVVGQ